MQLLLNIGSHIEKLFHAKPFKISQSYSSHISFYPNQALKFQGRLKYLHGQRDNGTSNKPQLALFTIAMPVQPPSIVEIRAKMLLFQSKHKLDFTPMGIDSRCYKFFHSSFVMYYFGCRILFSWQVVFCQPNRYSISKYHLPTSGSFPRSYCNTLN